MSYLVLIRHGITDYNAKGLWTGWDDPDLTEKGIQEARDAGEKLKDIHFDHAFTPNLIRTKHTLEEIKSIIGQNDLPTTIAEEFKERDYGDYTAKNKWEIKEQLGEEEFLKLRRSWDYPIPNGESLKQVYERVMPYYQNTIVPYLKEGKNILITSSGNALRALVKYLENISDDEISNLEIGTGDILVYTINEHGIVVNKEKRATNPTKV